MLKIKYDNPNENAHFISGILQSVSETVSNNVKWLISELELVPKYNGDYSPTGKNQNPDYAYHFTERIRNEHIVLCSGSELRLALEESTSVRWGVFLGFLDKTSTDVDFYPTVEVEEIELIQHPLALIEIRIIDGDIIEILSRDEEIISRIQNIIEKI